MKTQKEMETELKRLEQLMRDNIPNEDEIKQLQDYVQAIIDKTISDKDRMKILVKVMSRPVEVISIDAQIFRLKWALYE